VSVHKHSSISNFIHNSDCEIIGIVTELFYQKNRLGKIKTLFWLVLVINIIIKELFSLNKGYVIIVTIKAKIKY
jgi:hypothetical protein